MAGFVDEVTMQIAGFLGWLKGFAFRRPVERGATAVEYALMVGLIGVGITAAASSLQTKTSATFNKVLVENLALNKPSTQSTLYSVGYASIVNNGQTDETPWNFNHTRREANPWWEVDLESVRKIDSIDVLPRLYCCVYRLTDFTIVISPTPIVASTAAAALSAPGVSSATFSNPAGMAATKNFPFPAGTKGRYVRIWADNTNSTLHGVYPGDPYGDVAASMDYLSLSEVSVNG